MWRGKLWTIPFIMPVGLALSASPQNKTTIQVPLKSGDSLAVVTFEADRHSVEEIKRWMELAKEGSYSEPRTAFSSCHSEFTSEYVPRYRAAIDDTAQLIKELDPSTYPSELSRVVTYLRRLQSFWLWLDEEQLNFLSVGTVPVTKWDDIDTGPRCERALTQLRHAKTSLQRCRAVLFEWNNCVNKTVQDRIGIYPQKSWEAFLQAENIQVRMLSTVGD